MKRWLSTLSVLLFVTCIGTAHAGSYTYHAGDTIHQQINIAFDNFYIHGSISYTFSDSAIWDGHVMPEVIDLDLSRTSANIPEELVATLTNIISTEFTIDTSVFRKRILTSADLNYTIGIFDANMDGRKDIGIVHDLFSKNSYEDIWVNLHGKLYHCYGLSVPVHEWDIKKRAMLAGWNNTNSTLQWYSITGDTTLVPTTH